MHPCNRVFKAASFCGGTNSSHFNSGWISATGWDVVRRMVTICCGRTGNGTAARRQWAAPAADQIGQRGALVRQHYIYLGCAGRSQTLGHAQFDVPTFAADGLDNDII